MIKPLIKNDFLGFLSTDSRHTKDITNCVCRNIKASIKERLPNNKIYHSKEEFYCITFDYIGQNVKVILEPIDIPDMNVFYANITVYKPVSNKSGFYKTLRVRVRYKNNEQFLKKILTEATAIAAY